MPITGTIRKTVDLDHGVQMTPLGQLFASADHNAHTFEVTLTASGKAVDVSGAGVFAYFIRNDQKTVVVTSGKAQRNVVTVTLPESCYVTDRQAAHFQLIIKVSSTPDRKAVFWGDGYITRSTTDTIIDPGHEIPSLEELLAMVAEVEGVTTAARDATSKANTATTQANAARDAANTAAGAANTAKANADAATKKANDAATVATTAKTNADAATQAANDAATAANTAKTNADTATKKANDAASAATTATTNANAATKSANDAAAAANTAKTNADSATAKANTAATNADTATGKANTATANANAATTNANNAANLIKNMTVTTTKVAAGGTPTATLTTANNPDRYNLNIGVVTGDTGKTGAKGATGAAAGFGAITATVDNKVGTPSVEVTKGGPATATTLNFAFHNLKGNTGEIGNITVNGKGPDATGNFTVDAASVGALPSTTTIPKLYAATGTAADGAMTQKAVTDALNAKANSSALSSYVPTTRKVNNKALSADISLTAADVGAVPTTRKVNSKALSTDISLTAADVGALASNGTAAAASKLATARTFPAVNLASTSTSSFDGSKNPTAMGVSGTLPVSHGGTGVTSLTGTSGLIHAMFSSTSVTGNKYFPFFNDDYAAGGYVPSSGMIGAIGAVPATRTINSKALSSNISLTASDVGALASNGTATAASKLATARTFPAVNLASTATSSFDGSANPTALGVTGTLPIGHGGTGKTTAAEALKALGGVPTSRTINKKALTANISLTAADVGAVSTSKFYTSASDTYSQFEVVTKPTANNKIDHFYIGYNLYDGEPFFQYSGSGIDTKYHGLFPAYVKAYGGDCNNLITDGLYRIQGTSDAPLYNSPSSSTTDCDFYLLVFSNGVGWTKQLAFDVRSDSFYIRTCRDGWHSWKSIYKN